MLKTNNRQHWNSLAIVHVINKIGV